MAPLTIPCTRPLSSAAKMETAHNSRMVTCKAVAAAASAFVGRVSAKKLRSCRTAASVARSNAASFTCNFRRSLGANGRLTRNKAAGAVITNKNRAAFLNAAGTTVGAARLWLKAAKHTNPSQ